MNPTQTWTTTNSAGICLGLKLVASLLRYLGVKGSNKLEFDTVFGQGCSASFCIRKMDLEEIFAGDRVQHE
jgi:hypothetical protein